MTRINHATCWVAIGLAVTVAGNVQRATAGDGDALVRTLMQDEQRRLPPDNTVLFSAASRTVTLQLDALGQLDGSRLAGTTLTVISPDGQRRQYQADSSGEVEIADITEGPHAVVANNPQVHGSTLLVMQEEKKADPRLKNVEVPVRVGTGRMTLVRANADQILPIVDKYLPPSAAASTLAASDLADVSAFGPAAYRVRVADDGRLFGQVLSLIASGISGSDVAGTHLSLFRDGRPFAQTIADARGRFMVPSVTPGPYGIIAAGPAGYAAFGFDVIPGSAVVDQVNDLGERFVATANANAATQVSDVLPVVLIPPAYIPQLVDVLRTFYGPLFGTGIDGVGGLGGLAPIPGVGPLAPGGFAPGAAGFGPGGGFGGGGGAMGGGGFGGLGGLASLAAIGAVVAATDDDDNPIIPIEPVSPVNVPSSD